MWSLLAGALCGVSYAQMNGDAPGGLYHRSAVEKGLGAMEPVPHELSRTEGSLSMPTPPFSTQLMARFSGL